MRQYFLNWLRYFQGFKWLFDPPADHDQITEIRFRPGWTPLKFLLPYLTTYLLSTLLGLGIRPFSGYAHSRGWRVTRLLDKLLGKGHCAQSAKAPLLWGSRSVW